MFENFELRKPQKRGFESGTIRTVIISHTVVDVFDVHFKGYSLMC